MPRATVAVDALGGDRAPGAIVAGAVRAARGARIPVALVGPPDLLHVELARAGDARGLPITIIEAADGVAMDESPLAALRRKPRASVKVAAELVASGRADALFSAGHTGATVLAARTAFGLLPGVERPALAVTIPTRSGAAVLVDAGANIECRAQHLVQFGLMGAAYARANLGLADPRVGLLSIGEEAAKGNDLVREAHAGLATVPLTFVGNVEARELFTGRADVIVCDGFTGNIALKVGEGLVEMLEGSLLDELTASWLARVGAWLSRRAYANFRRRVDYAEYGGAPLLGVAGLTVVAHGGSTVRAIENGIVMTARLAEARMTERLAAALAPGD